MARAKLAQVGIHGIRVMLKVEPRRIKHLLEQLGDRLGSKKPRMTMYSSEATKGWEAPLSKFKGLSVALESNGGLFIYMADRGFDEESDYIDQMAKQDVFLVAQGNWFDNQSRSNWLSLLMFVDESAVGAVSIDAYIDDYGYRSSYTPAQFHRKIQANVEKRARAVIDGTDMPMDISSKILDKYLKDNDPVAYGSAKEYSFARLSSAGSRLSSVTFNQRQEGPRIPKQMLTCYHKATEQKLLPNDKEYADYDYVRYEAKLSGDVGKSFVVQLINQLYSGKSFEDALVDQTRSAIVRIIDIRTADGSKRADRWHRIVGGVARMRVQSKRIKDKVENELEKLAEQEDRLTVRYLMAKAWRGSRVAFQELRNKSHLLKQQDLSRYQAICGKYGVDQSIDDINEEIENERRIRLN